MAEILTMPGVMPPMSTWRKPEAGVSTSYTHLKDYPDNKFGQAIAVCGGVSDKGDFTYAILMKAAAGCVDNFAIVAEWPALAVDVESVITIADVVSSGVRYAGVLMPDDDEGGSAA